MANNCSPISCTPLAVDTISEESDHANNRFAAETSELALRRSKFRKNVILDFMHWTMSGCSRKIRSDDFDTAWSYRKPACEGNRFWWTHASGGWGGIGRGYWMEVWIRMSLTTLRTLLEVAGAEGACFPSVMCCGISFVVGFNSCSSSLWISYSQWDRHDYTFSVCRSVLDRCDRIFEVVSRSISPSCSRLFASGHRKT